MNCFFSSAARCPQAALNPRQIPFPAPSGQRAPCIGAAAQQQLSSSARRRVVLVGENEGLRVAAGPAEAARTSASCCLFAWRRSSARRTASSACTSHPPESPCIPRVSAHTPQRATAAEIRSVSSGCYLSPTARTGLACTTAASIAIAILMVSRVITPTAYLRCDAARTVGHARRARRRKTTRLRTQRCARRTGVKAWRAWTHFPSSERTCRAPRSAQSPRSA